MPQIQPICGTIKWKTSHKDVPQREKTSFWLFVWHLKLNGWHLLCSRLGIHQSAKSQHQLGTAVCLEPDPGLSGADRENCIIIGINWRQFRVWNWTQSYPEIGPTISRLSEPGQRTLCVKLDVGLSRSDADHQFVSTSPRQPNVPELGNQDPELPCLILTFSWVSGSGTGHSWNQRSTGLSWGQPCSSTIWIWRISCPNPNIRHPDTQVWQGRLCNVWAGSLNSS